MNCMSLLPQLWQNEDLADCIIWLDDGSSVKAHKVILAGCSGFFYGLLCGAGRHMANDFDTNLAGLHLSDRPGTCLQHIHLHEVNAEGLQVMLKAMYTNEIEITETNVEELLSIASYLDIASIVHECCQFLVDRLSIATCLTSLVVASQHGALELYQSAMALALGNFDQLLESDYSGQLELLPYADLYKLVTSDDLHARSVRFLLVLHIVNSQDVAMSHKGAGCTACGCTMASCRAGGACRRRWRPDPGREDASQSCADCDKSGAAENGHGGSILVDMGTTRQWTVSRLMTEHDDVISASLCCRDVLDRLRSPVYAKALSEKAVLALTAAAGACCTTAVTSTLLQTAAAESSTAATVHAQVSRAGQALPGPRLEGREGCWWTRPRRAVTADLLVAGGRDEQWRPLRLVELYSSHSRRWEVRASMLVASPLACAASFSSRAYLVTGSTHSTHVLQYDKHADRWTECPKLTTNRVHLAATSLADSLYVLGGKAVMGRDVPTVDVFSSRLGTWQAAQPMRNQRSSLAAVSIGCHILAIGGQSGRDCLASCEWLDPGSGQPWSLLKAHLHAPRKYAAAAVLDGRVMVAGGVDAARTRLPSMEAYDPREGIWHTLPGMTQPRSSFGLAALGGKLYAVGGNVGMHDDVTAAVEWYCPMAGKWQMADRGMGAARSGMAVAVL